MRETWLQGEKYIFSNRKSEIYYNLFLFWETIRGQNGSTVTSDLIWNRKREVCLLIFAFPLKCSAKQNLEVSAGWGKLFNTLLYLMKNCVFFQWDLTEDAVKNKSVWWDNMLCFYYKLTSHILCSYSLDIQQWTTTTTAQMKMRTASHLLVNFWTFQPLLEPCSS